MRIFSFEKLISKSLERTRVILLRPFSAKKWLFLILIAFLAGALNGGPGGFNYSGSGPCGSKKGEAAVGQAKDPSALTCPLKSAGDIKGKFFQFLSDPFLARGIVALAGLAVILMLVMMWLGARFNFVWVEAMLKNDASVREPFRRYQKEGDSLFNFFIASGLVFLAGIGLLVWWAFNVFYFIASLNWKVSGSVGTALASAAGPITGFLLIILVFVLAWVFVEHFVITVMALDRCSFMPAWHRCCGIFAKNRKDFFLYLLVIIVAGIASGILAAIAGIALMIVLALAAGILFGLPYLLLVFLLKAKIIFFIYAAIAGIPFGLVSLALLAAIGLPFAVFFKSLAFYFLSSLECGYKPLDLA